MRSSTSNYGIVAVSIHWLSALFIVGLLISGFLAANTMDATTKQQILTLHAPLGFTVLALTLARIAWWKFADRKPNPVVGMPAWQEFCARAIHLLLYVVILGTGASGIGMFALSGAAGIIFGGDVSPLPNFAEFTPRIPHGIGARVFVLLLILHVGAALHHHYVRKDGLLARMWFHRRTS